MINASEASNAVIKFLTDNGYNLVACAKVKILPMIMLRWLSNEITDEEVLNYLDKLNIINKGDLRIDNIDKPKTDNPPTGFISK